MSLTVLVGAPASGKSQHASSYPGTIVSADRLRDEAHSGSVLEAVRERVAGLLAAGESVVVDACNVDRTERALLLEAGRAAGADCRAVYLATAPETVVSRNERRSDDRRVPRDRMTLYFAALQDVEAALSSERWDLVETLYSDSDSIDTHSAKESADMGDGDAGDMSADDSSSEIDAAEIAEADAAAATEIAEAAKWKALSRKHERALRSAQKELDSLRSGDEKRIEQIRTEAYETARAETLALATKRLVSASILAAAAGRFADPSDAVALVDASAITVAEDGTVDAESIETALGNLLEAKPHLSAARTPALPGATATDSPAPQIDDWIRSAAGYKN